MNTIFIGGSRHVSRLPAEIKKRLDNVIASGHRVIVGDASGADKAVQKHFLEKCYDNVTVFCSGATPRNNLGIWRTRQVDPPKGAKGFHFHAAKDRAMAQEADFGLMIWDGKSPGTILNVLRLTLAGKIAVLFHAPEKEVVTIKTLDTWKNFLSRCSREVRLDVKDRATANEWKHVESDQPSLLTTFDGISAQIDSARSDDPTPNVLEPATVEQVAKTLNDGFVLGDAAVVMRTLGTIARERGMSHIARETGLARESLYRSLDEKGNPEFATVLKVLSSIGLRLEAKPQEESVKSRGRTRGSTASSGAS